MIAPKARAVLDRLERQDALERQRGGPRRERLRQVTPDGGRFLHIPPLEIAPAKVRGADANLRDAGLTDVATLLPGDAFEYLRGRTEPVDFVFLDAEKEDHLAFLDLIVPLLPARRPPP